MKLYEYIIIGIGLAVVLGILVSIEDSEQKTSDTTFGGPIDDYNMPQNKKQICKEKIIEPITTTININGKVLSYETIDSNDGSKVKHIFNVKNSNDEYGGDFTLNVLFKPRVNINIGVLGIPVDAELFEDQKGIYTLTIPAGSTGEIYFITDGNYRADSYEFKGEQKTITENKVIEREVYC